MIRENMEGIINEFNVSRFVENYLKCEVLRIGNGGAEIWPHVVILNGHGAVGSYATGLVIDMPFARSILEKIRHAKRSDDAHVVGVFRKIPT